MKAEVSRAYLCLATIVHVDKYNNERTATNKIKPTIIIAAFKPKTPVEKSFDFFVVDDDMNVLLLLFFFDRKEKKKALRTNVYLQGSFDFVRAPRISFPCSYSCLVLFISSSLFSFYSLQNRMRIENQSSINVRRGRSLIREKFNSSLRRRLVCPSENAVRIF